MDTTAVLTAPLAELGTQARGYLAQSKAANTRRAYAADWRTFTAWCDQHGLTALPAAPETVALYLTAHAAAGDESPTRSAAVRAVWAGIRRQHGTAQVGKAPAQVDELRRMVATL